LNKTCEGLANVSALQSLSIDSVDEGFDRIVPLDELAVREICSFTGLTRLSLCQTQIDGTIADRLPDLKQEQHLTLGMTFTDEVALACACTELPALTRLALQHWDTPADELADVAGVLGSMTALQELELSSLVLSEGRGDILVCQLSSLSRLTALSLKKCALCSECDADLLQDVLVCLSQLRRLDLSGVAGANEEGGALDTFAGALEHALHSLASVEWLDLSQNHIGSSRVSALCSALPRGSTSLGFAANSVGHAGATALGAAVASLSSLQLLDISNNCLGGAGIKAVVQPLAQLQRLELLDVHDNSPDGANAEREQILPMLEQLAAHMAPHLPEGTMERFAPFKTELRDRDAAVAGAGCVAAALAPHVAALRTLRDINVASCGLSDTDAVRAQARAMATLPALARIRMRHNALGPEGAAALAPLLLRRGPALQLEVHDAGLGDSSAGMHCSSIARAACDPLWSQ
jgi:Leucine Rich repeat